MHDGLIWGSKGRKPLASFAKWLATLRNLPDAAKLFLPRFEKPGVSGLGCGESRGIVLLCFIRDRKGVDKA